MGSMFHLMVEEKERAIMITRQSTPRNRRNPAQHNIQARNRGYSALSTDSAIMTGPLISLRSIETCRG